jgi:hypothetical protein
MHVPSLMRDQILRPYKTHKIIDLRVLSFTFLHRIEEDIFILFLVSDNMNFIKYSVGQLHVSSQYAHLGVLR